MCTRVCLYGGRTILTQEAKPLSGVWQGDEPSSSSVAGGSRPSSFIAAVSDAVTGGAVLFAAATGATGGSTTGAASGFLAAAVLRSASSAAALARSVVALASSASFAICACSCMSLRSLSNLVAAAFSLRASASRSAEEAPACPATGEQWVLFQMDVELDSGVTGTLVCHQGDVAAELAAQFCLKHSLADEFIPVLAGSVQAQIDACLSTRC